MARIYMVRKRESDGCWDYTVSSDEEGWAHATGACGKEKCFHKTKEEAQDHQNKYVAELIKAAPRLEIDTKFGHQCYVKGCEKKAFHRADIKHCDWPFPVEGCDEHLDNPVVGAV